jgi:hypothetical protein
VTADDETALMEAHFFVAEMVQDAAHSKMNNEGWIELDMVASDQFGRGVVFGSACHNGRYYVVELDVKVRDVPMDDDTYEKDWDD